MKYLIILVISLLIASWVGLNLKHDPGLMIVSLAGWRVDIPLWIVGIALIAFYAIFQLIVGFLIYLVHSTKFIANLSTHFYKKRAKRLTNKGLVALAEGRWAKAESLLIKGAAWSEIPWLNYFSAAKAAQELGKDDKRDFYLKSAAQLTPETQVAIGLTQADLQYKHHQYEQSLATLKQLTQTVPNHPYLLTLLQKIYVELQDWNKLLELLPKLKHHHALKAEEYKELEKEVYYQLLVENSKGPLAAVTSFWQKIPRECRHDGKIASTYAKVLLKDNNPVEAESILRAALKHEWQEDLIRLYGHLSHPSLQKVLNLAESWLNTHSQSPSLLLTLGRLCERQQLWGKAQRYFEASLSLKPDPETYAELGSLLEKMNKPELGAQYFKKGLLLAMPQGKGAKMAYEMG